jgi:hypothetical protein
MTASHPQVVQTASHFHDPVREAFLMIAEGLFDDTTPFDTSDDMLNFNPETSNDAIEKEVLSG